MLLVKIISFPVLLPSEDIIGRDPVLNRIAMLRKISDIKNSVGLSGILVIKQQKKQLKNSNMIM